MFTQMWLAGVIGLMLVSIAIVQILGLERRRAPALPLWDIPRVAGFYTTIVGSLAGFAVASSVFIANLARGDPQYEDAMAMFIVAFLVLIGTTMQFAATPNLAESAPGYVADQQLSYSVANVSFYVGVAVAWLGLRLLVLASGFDTLGKILSWILFFSITAGAFRLSMHIYRHTLIGRLACFSIPAIAAALTLLYRFGAAEVIPDLWPAENQALYFAALAFLAGGLAYGSQTFLLALHGDSRWERIVASYGPSWLLGYCQASVLTIYLLWLAVVQT
jgi:hypothetical protein